ncbi:uncharacterized protein LOC141906465 [Tubulanus polymorphus]|uniref:uncharacterized protein LOC141906465 n=1 Tax=Tubulanus polymorphus TaxID=672921 RepID=UPI003DA3B5FB
MGSGASSRVKDISIARSESLEDSNSGSKTKRDRCCQCGLVSDAELIQSDQRLTITWVDQAEAKIKSLEWRLAEAESQKLDLTDQIQALEEHVNSLCSKTLETQSGLECSETVKLKDAHIKKLEKETKAVHDEIHNLRVRYKKKLRAANTKLITARQETSLRIFELKGEIEKLTDEKSGLQDDLRKYQKTPVPTAVNSNADSEEDSRTQIILQLSQQITEQNDKIHKLENQLSDVKNVSSRPNSSKVDGDKSAESSAELKSIAGEMQASKETTVKHRPKSSAGNRKSSGMSRDSGLASRENSSYVRPVSGRVFSASSNISVITGSDISLSTPPDTDRIGSSKTNASSSSTIGSANNGDVSDLEFDGAELLEDFIVPNEASLKLLKEMDKRVITPVQINSPRIKVK